jgi:hypothetical protein
MKIVRLLQISVSLTGLLFASVSQAVVINVDFQGPGGSPSTTGILYTGQGILGGALDTNWNAANIGTTSGLFDGEGNATGISVTTSLSGTYGNSGNTLLSDRLIFGPNPAMVSITGLDVNSFYNIVGYNGYFSQLYSIAGHTDESTSIVSGSWNNSFSNWSEGEQFVQFDNAMSDSLGNINITLSAINNGPYGAALAIAGLQIENVSIPEPSILALMGLGIFGLGLSRRRMKK